MGWVGWGWVAAIVGGDLGLWGLLGIDHSQWVGGGWNELDEPDLWNIHINWMEWNQVVCPKNHLSGREQIELPDGMFKEPNGMEPAPM